MRACAARPRRPPPSPVSKARWPKRRSRRTKLPGPVAAQSQSEAPPRADEAERPAAAAAAPARPATVIDAALLDRVAIGVLIFRHGALLHANRHFLEWTGYDDLAALAAAGGLNALFVAPDAGSLAENTGAQALSIMTRRGDTLPVDGRLISVPWDGAAALALILSNGLNAERRRAAELALAAAETELRNARRETQNAAAAKAEFLAKISHEIR